LSKLTPTPGVFFAARDRSLRLPVENANPRVSASFLCAAGVRVGRRGAARPPPFP